jgi:isoamylase
VNFILPAVADGLSWLGLIDTNRPDERMPEFEFGHAYAVTGRSLLVFGLANDNIATRRLRQGLGALLDIADTPLSG